ncbi:MAG: hypothetical protein HC888_12830 [Candidatus Competibacteraceae bacterium]|nr:hypothetical protein [Candidatus Competibacteraceae bacterium]
MERLGSGGALLGDKAQAASRFHQEPRSFVLDFTPLAKIKTFATLKTSMKTPFPSSAKIIRKSP